MRKRLQVQRLAGLAVLLCVGFGGLAYRLVDLQILRHEELTQKAQQNTEHEFLLQPRRGDILDIKGNLLATSALVKMVCVDPTLLSNRQPEVAHCLAPLLDINETKLAESLMPRVRQNAKGQTVPILCVILKRKVPVETWEKIHLAMTGLTFGLDEKALSRADRTFYHNLRYKAVYAQDDQLRIYPNQALAAHVLGYATPEDYEVNDTPVSEIRGKDGLEHYLDAKLRGVSGWRLTETDRQNRELVTLREQEVEPRNGLNVVLTIDSVLQHIMESALAEAMEKHSPLSVSGLAIRPRTGEILALATLPNFDPNNPGKYPPEARRNRVITDIAEPGSTFKVVVVAGALNDGTIRLSDSFDCEHGHFFYGGRTLKDHESYGVLSAEEIITHSSNIGAAKIGIQLGEKRLYDYICNFGFGATTGIPLPAEVSAHAFVPSPKKWSKVTIAQIPMGQGICVTRLQMTLAMCAIANKGWLMRPMLVDRLEDSDHNIVAKYSPQRVRQVIGEPAAKLMVQALKTVVGPEGTAPKAALEHYPVAGKTGTAQKAENGVYVPGKYFSSFMGFFPADNPELCISVMLDEPDRKKGYYGGQIAAPIFKQIAERAANYLNIRPEDGDAPSPSEPQIMPVDNRSLKTAAARSQ